MLQCVTVCNDVVECVTECVITGYGVCKNVVECVTMCNAMVECATECVIIW